LGQAVAPAHAHVGPRNIQHLDHDLVLGTVVIRVDDANPIGHDQSTLERAAASGENREEVAGRDFDDQSCPYQCNAARRHRQIV